MLEPIYINLEPELAEQLEQKRREDLQFQLTKLGHFQESLEIYPKEFPVRWVWCDEAMYFTPWLKKHLKYLQPFICYPIHTVASQVQIVNFWIDLVAYSYNHDSTPIELQLEKSDHKHLGQIIAYLSLQNANSAIWITTRFTQGHKEVIKILNQSNFALFHLFTIHVVLREPNCSYEIMLKPVQL